MTSSYFQNLAECAREMTQDKIMMANKWRDKIVACDPDDWGIQSKRMCQLLDRMDRQHGDRQESVGTPILNQILKSFS